MSTFNFVKMKRPIVLTALLCAIVCLTLININFRISILIAAIFLMATIICIFYKSLHEFIVIAMLLLTLCLSFYSTYSNHIVPAKNISKHKANITGIVTDYSYRYEDVILYYVKVTDSDLSEIIGTTVMLYDNTTSAGVGLTINADTTVSFINDGKSFYSNNIYFKGHINKLHSSRDIPCLDSSLGKFRGKLRNIIFSNLPYDIATTINGLTIGERSYEEDSFYAAVKNCGVTHVMVVSGMHMVIVCGSVYKLLKFLKLPPRIASVITFGVTIMFMALCGFTPSVLRAGIMYIIMLLGVFLYRAPDALNSLSISFVLMLICNPFLLTNVGFLLSILSTAGIIIINPLLLKLIKTEKWKAKTLRVIAELATVTISAQIATLPICLCYFGWISPWAILVNILISHAVTIAVISAFIGILLYAMPFISPISILPFKLCSFVTAYFNNVIEFFGNI